MATGNGRGAIINIDQLLSPDITFVVGQERWTIQGNISARATLAIQSYTNAMFEAMNEGDVDKTVESYAALHDYLVPLFQYKRPGLTDLDWDFPTMMKISGIILARALGADAQDLADTAAETDPPTTPRNRQQRRSPSTRATGSARS